MAYQMNVDYKALIDKEMAKGINADKNQINRLQQARAEKMAANPDMLNKWGITPQSELNAGQNQSNLQNLGLRDYINKGGITGDKKYELGNIGSTPTINGIAVNPSSYGLSLKNDRWVGTQDQLNNLLQPFNEQMSTQATNNVTAVPQAEQENKYSALLENQLQNFLGSNNFQYDATQDPTYNQYMQAATKQIQDQVIKDMNRRGIMTSTLTGDQISKLVSEQAALALPQFRQQALGEYQSNLQNMMNKYNATRELEESAYGRGQDTFMNKITEAGITGNYEGLRTLEGQNLDWNKETTAWEQQFQNKQFDWNKTMDIVGNTQWGKEYGLRMAQFDWDKNKNNPINQAQIIDNKMSLINLDNLSDEWKKKLKQMDADLNATNVSIEERKKNIEIANAELDKLLNEQIYGTGESTYSYSEAKSIIDKSGIIKKGTSTINKEKMLDFYNELERLQDIGVSDDILFQIANSYTNVDLDKVYKMLGGD